MRKLTKVWKEELIQLHFSVKDICCKSVGRTKVSDIEVLKRIRVNELQFYKQIAQQKWRLLAIFRAEAVGQIINW